VNATVGADYNFKPVVVIRACTSIFIDEDIILRKQIAACSQQSVYEEQSFEEV
jgi:hypothetical protein